LRFLKVCKTASIDSWVLRTGRLQTPSDPEGSSGSDSILRRSKPSYQ